MTNSPFKHIVLWFLVLFGASLLHAQERIPMTLEKSGIYTIPCEVNGLRLNFVFDTGASAVHISLVEAAFMLKNGYISENDFIGTGTYSMADGSIAENALINLHSIKIGNVTINDVTACVSSNINASLLLGQSAIKKLGKYTIEDNYLILYNTLYKDDECLDNQFKLWSALSDEYEMGTFEDFQRDISDENKRRKLYDAINDEYDLPNYATFSAQLGFSEVLNNLWGLYNTLLKEDYNPPAFEQFVEDMQDEENLRGAYSTLLKEGYTPPPFELFKKDMGFVVVSNRSKQNSNTLSNNSQDYYLAQTNSNTYLYESPNNKSKVLTRIPKGAYVFMSSSDKNDSFRKVIFVDKNIIGYIQVGKISNLKKVDVDESGTLQVESRNYKSTADIKIENNTNKNTTISLGNTSYSFKPHEIKTITDILPGNYTIMASSPGVIPFVAVDNVEAGYVYSWIFFIETVRR